MAMGTSQVTPLIGSLSEKSKSRQKVEIYDHIGEDFAIHTGNLGAGDPRGVP